MRSCLFPARIGSSELSPSWSQPGGSACSWRGESGLWGCCLDPGGDPASWEGSTEPGITQHPRHGAALATLCTSPEWELTPGCFSSALSSSSASAITRWQQQCQETRSNLCWQLGVGGEGCRCSRRRWHGDAARAGSWHGFCAVCRTQTPLPCCAQL